MISSNTSSPSKLPAREKTIMIRRILLLSLLLTFAANAATAQRPLKLNLGGGVTLPVGDLADGVSPGWHALAGLEVSSFMQPLGLHADVAYNRLNAKATGPNQAISSATAGLSYRLPMTDSPLSPYVIAAAGAYRAECTDSVDCGSTTKFGWNAGLGTKVAAIGAKWFLESRFHSMHATAGAKFVSATLGLTF